MLDRMKTFPSLLTRLTLAFLISLLAVSLRAHTAADEMSQAAANLLVALTPNQKDKAHFEFKSDERANWHYIPKARQGLPFKELTPTQSRLAFALLASGLSQRGFVKATTIMSLEEILH